MISNIQRNIIIRALRIRVSHGEKPEEILSGYTKLSDKEKTDILAAVKDGGVI
ncbi:hypothetical protein [Enterocloster citroniae]|uniref:Uncharacterized protein n=1 Tax=[Clostridium] citroniae WAL-17108 TaxID=742733 RepID=G5HEU6_9FIRM|nr:hypothetical protein [Enterocloster citroniae]EHF00055.1 hypothetical protein HMPREF9469_00969 [ [[Clostridium] citroniae WAL-17108]DAT42543.1 MAG TPA: hypothetical protein [Caudoviricetes sp.]